MPKNKLIRYFLALGIVCLLLLLFKDSFSAYYFQDDWFSLSISRARSVGDFLAFFVPRSELIYYRPLGMQVPFFLAQSFFGLNPLPFRIMTFILHLINGVLVYLLLSFLVKNKRLAQFGSLLYVTSATHMIVFYWAATFAFVLGPTIYLASVLSFLYKRYKWSVALFILGLFVNEMLVTLPLILLLLSHQQLRKNFLRYIPFLTISFGYALFRLTIARVPTTGAYALLDSFHSLIINTRNYFLWAFNWPDEISNQFVGFFKLNPLFVREFFPFISWNIATSIFIFIFALAVPLGIMFKSNHIQKNIRLPFLGLVWFGITLLPVLIFSQHAFSYYVPISLVGLLVGICSMFEIWYKKFKNYSWVVLLLILTFWIYSSQRTLYFDTLIHWAPQRAVRSHNLINKITSQFPSLPSGANVVISDIAGATEDRWALGDQNAVHVLYNDTSITTIYGEVAEGIDNQYVVKE